MSAHKSPTPPHSDFWEEIKANSVLWIRVCTALGWTNPLLKEGAVNVGKLWEGVWCWALTLLCSYCDLQRWMWWCLRFGLGAAPGHRLCTGFLGSVITGCSAEHSPSSAQFEQLLEETFSCCCKIIICWVPHLSSGPLFFSLISQYMFGLLFCKPFQEGSFWTHGMAFDCKLPSYSSHRHACVHPHSSGNTQLFIIQAILFDHNSTMHDCCRFLWEK